MKRYWRTTAGVQRLLDALHPLEDRPADAFIGCIGRHHLGDVAVLLIYDVGHVAGGFLELIPQRLGEPDDVGGIELGYRDHERYLRSHQPGKIRTGQLRGGVRRRPTSRAQTATARPASASGCRSGGRTPIGRAAGGECSALQRRRSYRKNVEGWWRHKDHGLETNALRSPKLGVGYIGAERNVPGGLRPRKNPLRIPFVLC